MSYKALYRKYRPANFNDVLGQDHIISTLQNIISGEKISHAYLFSGPRGTGKTSVAHVFAREINKTASGNVNLNALDIIEIDAASNNGVAEVRSLIEASKYAPTESKYKVYIIDEVHMLTKGAFNALLKTLEEPPAHVIFILATTEPEKIPVTILSRLQRFNFKRIDQKVIVAQLKDILAKENIVADEESIRFIARLAQGGMRDALSIADQAAAYANNQINFQAIAKVFGIVSIENQLKFLQIAYEQKTNEILSMASKFIEEGIDLEKLITSLVDILRDYIVYQKTSDVKLLETLNVNELKKLTISVNFAYQAIEILIELISKIKQSLMARQTFELALIKLTTRDEVIKNDIIEKPIIKEEVVSEKIFETAETVIKANDEQQEQDELIATDELVTDSKEEKIIDTDELSLSTDTVLETQEIDVADNIITEEILSTQEIELESETSEKQTEEIDLVSMFNSNTMDIQIEQPEVAKPNIDSIINLLVQANKEQVAVAKSNLENVASYASNNNFKSYVSLFENTKLIAKGNNFALLTSSSDSVIKQIRRDTSRQSLIDFVNEVFNGPTQLFVVTMEEFEAVKKHYQTLSNSKQLPKPVAVMPPKVSEKPKSQEETYGNDLFGDLFS